MREERSWREESSESCAGESGRTAYHHQALRPSLHPILSLSFSVFVSRRDFYSRGPVASQAAPLLLSLSLSLFLPLSVSPSPLSNSLALSAGRSVGRSVCVWSGPWWFSSRESGRGAAAASRAREMPVIRRDFSYAHYESFSPRETRGPENRRCRRHRHRRRLHRCHRACLPASLAATTASFLPAAASLLLRSYVPTLIRVDPRLHEYAWYRQW